MTLNVIRQQKYADIRNVLAKLLIIKEIKHYSQIDVARLLGYKKDVFAAIKDGQTKGSTQLEAAIDLLLENLRMSKRIEELEQTIRGIQSVTGPPREQSHFEMNEKQAVSSKNQDLSGIKGLSEGYLRRKKKQ